MSTPDATAAEPAVEAPGFHMFDRGAHVTAWQPEAAQHPVLFSSSLAAIAPDTAWRGGIPICTPWFGTGPDGARTPNHGPARTARWTRVRADGSTTEHRLELEVDARGASARLSCTARTERTSTMLRSSLTVHNLGDTTATVEAALHSYLAVSDITAVQVTGLEEAAFHDKVSGASRGAEPRIEFGGLVDRIYDDTDTPITVLDPAWARSLLITRAGASAAIVWNPGPDASPGDLGPGQWREFVCVEAAMLGTGAARLDAGGTHELVSTITLA